MIHRHGPTAAGVDPLLPGAVRIQAFAKVNLFLEVLGRRLDGYHDIATLMLAIDLADELEFTLADAGELSLTCDDPALTVGPENLVLRAASRLREETGSTLGVRIHLRKRIPWAAGLGGGSSDAAAALEGLNELWKLGLSPAALARIGATIGSDVPFFLNGPAAWCTGRGEVIEPAAIGQPLDLVLVKPPAGLATAAVYKRLKAPAKPESGSVARNALANGEVETLGRALFNRLQEPAFELEPSVAEIFRQVQSSSAAGCLMSGSGSSVFALCRNSSDARQVHDDLSRGWASGGELSPRVFLVRSRP
ncbi:MAG TPA: 4-(cytidine 5'-diphospho)-2-C-methyl-D-erythritol kinase [Gemmataceae bacterium]|jgi:4-diphosphocytidyl-2-C-methyl-D-erythritol kinase|nr:4-(cytidine 5'-diphospho)-2-C-methyl-D-erythritol kinase [Gemmataceae bacterium]